MSTHFAGPSCGYHKLLDPFSSCALALQSSAHLLKWKVRLSLIQERNSKLVWNEAAPLIGVTPVDAQVGRKATALAERQTGNEWGMRWMERRKSGIGGGALGERWGAELTEWMGNLSAVILMVQLFMALPLLFLFHLPCAQTLLSLKCFGGY